MDEFREWNYAIDLTRDTLNSMTECSVKQSCTNLSEMHKPRKRKHDQLDDCDDELEKKRLLANSQERARMHKINRALDDLRKCLPQQFNLYHRRMSKIRTLRLAMSYINELTELIRNDDIRRHGEHREPVARQHIPVQAAALNMSDMSTTMIPYYPYLREACSGYSAIESMYRTPDQSHQQSLVYNPRQLNFGPVTETKTTPIHQEAKSHQEANVAVCEYTPVKHRSTKRLFKAEGVATPEPARGSFRSETITSPFLGIRYQDELSTSLPNTSYEDLGEDILEPGQIPNRGTGRTLADIIDEDD